MSRSGLRSGLCFALLFVFRVQVRALIYGRVQLELQRGGLDRALDILHEVVDNVLLALYSDRARRVFMDTALLAFILTQHDVCS